MIPGAGLSSPAVVGGFRGADARLPLTLAMGYVPTDWETGGVGLHDPSAGLEVQEWTFTLRGDTVVVRAADGSETELLTADGITELAGTFDANMAVAVAFVRAQQTTLYWYDTTIHDYTTTAVAGTSPRLTLDDKRPLHVADRDILLVYLRADKIYYRQQRDRYGTEYPLGDLPAGTERLGRVGMSTAGRVQVECLGAPV